MKRRISLIGAINAIIPWTLFTIFNLMSFIKLIASPGLIELGVYDKWAPWVMLLGIIFDIVGLVLSIIAMKPCVSNKNYYKFNGVIITIFVFNIIAILELILWYLIRNVILLCMTDIGVIILSILLFVQFILSSILILVGMNLKQDELNNTEKKFNLEKAIDKINELKLNKTINEEEYEFLRKSIVKKGISNN